ncbi:MAG: hypothetical protein R6V10_08010 [bacterium]
MSAEDTGILHRKEGGIKLWIMFFLVLLVAIGLGLGAVLPHYQAKWRLQDEMRLMLTDYNDYRQKDSYGNVEMYMESDLKKYVNKHELGFDPTQTHPKDLCKVEAEIRKEGKFECEYTAEVTLFDYHIYDMKMHAEAKLDKVPVD